MTSVHLPGHGSAADAALLRVPSADVGVESLLDILHPVGAGLDCLAPLGVFPAFLLRQRLSRPPVDRRDLLRAGHPANRLERLKGLELGRADAAGGHAATCAN